MAKFKQILQSCQAVSHYYEEVRNTALIIFARANGTISISRLTGESCVLTGTGIEDPNRDGNPLTVTLTVCADARSAPIITY